MELFNKKAQMTPFGENGVLFTAQYCILKKLLGKSTVNETLLAHRAIENSKVDDNLYDASAPEKGEGWSHDNHTAIVCLGEHFDLNVVKFPKDWYYRRIHPRDIVFYLYFILPPGVLRFIFKLLFFWVPSISMIVSCAQTYKYRNGKKIIKTDGKLLAWLRFNTVSMPITKWICTKIIEKKFTRGWTRVFEIYFGKDHPNSKLINNLEFRDYMEMFK